jgi:hypothetical protein
VPGIELNGDDVTQITCILGLGKAFDLAPDVVQEEGLATAPMTENTNREWQLSLSRRDQSGKGSRLVTDPDKIIFPWPVTLCTRR